MNCQDVQDLLHPYVDGELDLVRNIEIEEHLTSCAACARPEKELRSLRAALASPSLYYAAPAGLRDRLRLGSSLASPAREQPSLTFSRNRTWRLIAAAVIFMLIGMSVTVGLLLSRGTPSGGGQLENWVIASHVRSLQVNHLTDVVSSDRHTVKPWFRDKLDFSPQVPDLSAEGFPLTGGRLDYLDERPVAALVYQRGKHAINVLTWPAGGSGDKGVQKFSRQGFHIREWQRSGMNYWAISDLNDEDLDQFVRLFQEHTTQSQP
jgi:anti-sigma factor RsiW